MVKRENGEHSHSNQTKFTISDDWSVWLCYPFFPVVFMKRTKGSHNKHCAKIGYARVKYSRLCCIIFVVECGSVPSPAPRDIHYLLCSDISSSFSTFSNASPNVSMSSVCPLLFPPPSPQCWFDFRNFRSFIPCLVIPRASTPLPLVRMAERC